MPSAPMVNDVKETRKPLMELGGKWILNEPDVTADVAEEDRASEIDLKKRELPTTKNLCVLWAATDNFPLDTRYS